MHKHEGVKLVARDIIIMALLTAILVVQEELLAFLPNIQFTVFLLLLYAKTLGFKRTTLIIVVYQFLDALIMGAMSPLMITFQIVGWLIIPAVISLFCKKVENNIALACIAAGFALTYSWVMILPGMMMTGVTLWAYLGADVLFEVLLAVSSFASTLVLYNPLRKLFDKLKISG